MGSLCSCLPLVANFNGHTLPDKLQPVFCSLLLFGWRRRCCSALCCLCRRLIYVSAESTSLPSSYNSIVCSLYAPANIKLQRNGRAGNHSPLQCLGSLSPPAPAQRAQTARNERKVSTAILVIAIFACYLSAADKNRYTPSEMGSSLTVHMVHAGRKVPKWKRSVAWLSRSCPEHFFVGHLQQSS